MTEDHNTTAADEAAIRRLIARQISSWDAGDPDAYARAYTPDGDCVSFLGAHYRGREAIAASCEVPPASTLFKKCSGELAWSSRSPTYDFLPPTSR
jgi:uncharacterized protein (TIGR02246 family)